MMGSKECSYVCLLYFIIVSLDASGAMHTIKEKSYNHYHLDSSYRLCIVVKTTTH